MLKVSALVMWVVWWCGVGGGAGEEEHYRSRVWVCVGGGAACEGQALRRHCVVLRASCVRNATRAPLAVLLQTYGDTCADLQRLSFNFPWLRYLTVMDIHPNYSVGITSADVAVAALSAPYTELTWGWKDIAPEFRSHLPWIRRTCDGYPAHPPVKLFKNYSTYYSPLKTFLIAVLLPSFAFMLFFIYVTFGRTHKMSKNYEKVDEHNTV